MRGQYETLLEEIEKIEAQVTCSCCGQDLTESARCNILDSKYIKRDEFLKALDELSVKLDNLAKMEGEKEKINLELKQLKIDHRRAI